MTHTTDTPSSSVHTSVLVDEVLSYLDIRPGKVYVDATFGGGGHTRAILEADPTVTVIALDWDKSIIELCAPPLEEAFGSRLHMHWSNFAGLYKVLKKENIACVDGILADFGTSQYQIFEREGFSFMKETPLDMRMSPAHTPTKASDVINRYPTKVLAKIFYDLGEERYGNKIAEAIVAQRTIKKFTTTTQLAQFIEKLIPRSRGRRVHIHPATRVFQALRIYINQELEQIKKFLPVALQMLCPEGRLVCISFHSLEDRIVKQFIREHKDALEVLTKKPIRASEEEIEANISSRSAKLRAAQKK